ncbi:MAG: penicillin-binding protein activator [Paracoccaceae bacterium]
MFCLFDVVRKINARFTIILFAVFITACDPSALGNGPSINPGKPVPVALLVPGGSGNSGDDILAASLVNAARMAIADLGGIQIDLRIYDTAGNAENAVGAATQAVNEGAKIILGPVFAQSAAAVGVAVANRNVNVLSFSNNTAIAGGNVFVLGPTFSNTANRLARYAVSQGKGNILVVNGNDSSEQIGRDVISQAVVNSGGILAGVSSFELSQEGVINAIPQITSDARTSGAQAVFLTSGTSGALPFLAQLLPENGMDPTQIQYIGLQRWDIPASALTLPGVQHGWFALPDPGLSASFQTRYNAAYGTNPHPIAGLAYDGIAAIGALVAQGQSDALTRSALTQAAGFAGVNGVFRLFADGTNQRGLAIAQIQENQVVVIDPAPRSFGGAGL